MDRLCCSLSGRFESVIDRYAPTHDHPVSLIYLLNQQFHLNAPTYFMLERLRYDQGDMIRFKRFRYKVISAFFHCFDGSFDGAVCGDHDNRNIMFAAPNFAEHINAVHVGHFDVKKNQLRILPFQKLQS